MTAIALTIAGSDSGGGAGIQADLKTFSALGVYGASVLTALTAQNTRGVTGVHGVPSDFVRAQIDAVMSDLDVGAIKVGMLATSEIIEAVAAGLDAWPGPPVVIDPVMVAQSGDPLIDDGAVATLRDRLLPLATVITPNLPEAARLLATETAGTEADMADQGQALIGLGAPAVLMKGGHGDGPEAIDLLVTEDRVMRLAAPRVDTKNTHGTGCTLSSAIAAGIARGLSLDDAARRAKSYLTEALKSADALAIGSGHGPVHHFHGLWPHQSEDRS